MLHVVSTSRINCIWAGCFLCRRGSDVSSRSYFLRPQWGWNSRRHFHCSQLQISFGLTASEKHAAFSWGHTAGAAARLPRLARHPCLPLSCFRCPLSFPGKQLTASASHPNSPACWWAFGPGFGQGLPAVSEPLALWMALVPGWLEGCCGTHQPK